MRLITSIIPANEEKGKQILVRTYCMVPTEFATLPYPEEIDAYEAHRNAAAQFADIEPEELQLLRATTDGYLFVAE